MIQKLISKSIMKYAYLVLTRCQKEVTHLYRNKVIDDVISERLKEIFSYIAPVYKITIVEWNHDEDHVHVLFRAHPKTELTKFINSYKSASSRLVKKEFPEIKKTFMERNVLVKKFLPAYYRRCYG